MYSQETDELDEDFTGYLRTSMSIVDTVATSQDDEFLATAKSATYFSGNRSSTSNDHLVNMTLLRSTGSDTFAETVHMIGVKILWTSNALNDDWV